MRLSRFLLDHVEEILVAWEAFAKTLEPAALLVTSEALRDHAKQIELASKAWCGVHVCTPKAVASNYKDARARRAQG